MPTVYLYTNRTNEKVYVGQTWYENKRTQTHRYRVRTSWKTPFYDAVRKYGWDNFDKTVFDVETQDEMNNLEKLWIAILQTTDRRFGYNLHFGGNIGKHSPESIEKMRRVKLGHIATEESKRKVSTALKGIIRSAETRRKMSKPKSLEHCQKISEGMRGNQNGRKYPIAQNGGVN